MCLHRYSPCLQNIGVVTGLVQGAKVVDPCTIVVTFHARVVFAAVVVVNMVVEGHPSSSSSSGQ